jgi:hypothetical protein
MEMESKRSIAAIVEEMDKLEKKKQEEDALLDALVRNKLLFTVTGTVLEVQVQQLLEKLGFEILESEPGRVDLIVKYGDQPAVLEIKGVGGSSAEKYAAQLEKWVSTYNVDNEVKPKGILVMNAFKDEELLNRNQDVFPHQMLAFSVQREHCLITTLQLLGLYFEILRSPEKKDELIFSLYNTIGVYKGYEDWTQFISTE